MLKKIEKEFIFAENEVTASSHASTVLPLSDGSVLAAWFGGKREGDSSVKIYAAKRDPETGWRKPVPVSADDGVPHWNPVLHERNNGEIILYYKVGRKIANWVTKFVSSKDRGETWSAPQVLVSGDNSGGRGPVKNKCLRLSDGALLAPASIERDGKWLPFFDRSTDDGLTWERSAPLVRVKHRGAWVGLIQPTLWQDATGIVHALMRSDKEAIYRSESADGGVTWTRPRRTRLPNNNSGIDCARDEKGRLWLVMNPVAKDWGQRTPLALLVSFDDGKTFTPVFYPEIKKGEYSYPAVVCRQNCLFITYTYNRKQIVYLKAETE